MKNIKNKLKSQKGESLVELLASVMIVAVAVSLMYSGIMVASKINQTAKETDEQFYLNMGKTEQKQDKIPDDALTERKIIIEYNGLNISVDVDLFGGDDVYSYQRKE